MKRTDTIYRIFQVSVYVNCLQYIVIISWNLRQGLSIRLFRFFFFFFFFFVSTYCDYHCSLSHDTFEVAVLTQRSLFMQQYYMAVVMMLQFISSNKNALTKSALSLNFCLFAIVKLRPIQLTTRRTWPTWAPTGQLDNSALPIRRSNTTLFDPVQSVPTTVGVCWSSGRLLKRLFSFRLATLRGAFPPEVLH